MGEEKAPKTVDDLAKRGAIGDLDAIERELEVTEEHLPVHLRRRIAGSLAAARRMR